MCEEEKCYLRFLEGEESALEELIAIHRKALSVFLFGIIRDRSIAEELSIDTFADLVVSKAKFLNKSSFKTYLFSIGRNLAFQVIRDRKKHGNISLEEAVYFREVKDWLVESERNEMIYKGLQRLNVNYRETLLLVYFENMSYKEIGVILHKSDKQVANLVHRGKIALRKIFEEEGFVYQDE